MRLDDPWYSGQRWGFLAGVLAAVLFFYFVQLGGFALSSGQSPVPTPCAARSAEPTP